MNGIVHMQFRTVLLALTTLLPTAQPALASDQPTDDKPDRLVMIGIGPRLEPSYPGSRRTGIGPAPVVNVWSEDQLFPVETPDEGKGPTLFGSRNRTAAGLTFAFAPRRDTEAATQGLRTVGFGIEAGAFAETYIMPDLRLRGEVRHGIGGHSAPVGDVALDLVLRSKKNDRALLTIGPRLRVASGKHNRRFFGIDAAEAGASGLPQYAAKGGINSVGLVAGGYVPIDQRWGLFAFAGYDRLANSAAQSPLTSQRGRRDQLSGGIALTHVFRIRR